MDPKPSAGLERLAFKYRTLAELRARREEAETLGLRAFADDEGAVRRVSFHALAAEFPGALRELDVTPAAALRWKAMAIEAALMDLRGGGALSPNDAWMLWTVDYHALLREALKLKRWLAHRRRTAQALDEATVQAYLREEGLAATLESSAAARSLLESHLRPPRGRLQALVWQRLEARHGRPARDIERILFGGSRL